ncbi:protein of unknown function [Rhodovastum atsumiense]|nr:protein of unknown function [Rhodovastum atsumiense]
MLFGVIDPGRFAKGDGVPEQAASAAAV